MAAAMEESALSFEDDDMTVTIDTVVVVAVADEPAISFFHSYVSLCPLILPYLFD